MGLGMQKWIYGMRARAPFSMQRKKSFTALPTYSRKFKIQPSKQRPIYDFGIIFGFVLGFIMLLSITNLVQSFKQHQNKVQMLNFQKDDWAFNFLMKSGENRLAKGKISAAYSEFQLAYAIRPHDKKLQELMHVTSGQLCLEN
ncbi:hypothetical protein [Winogradskyella rapida]|uniref:Tetratricopeptide repeat protein n=1 Tax=Winogradskyella rapida TaxID=549701 RepID=A0ABW3KQC3_9FLAO